MHEHLEIISSKFPHISRNIFILWDTKECEDYLIQLILDHRGNRQGFPKDILVALLNLFKEHPDVSEPNKSALFAYPLGGKQP